MSVVVARAAMSSGALRSAESISRAPEGVAVRALTWVVGAWVAVTCVAGPWTGSGAEGVAGADQPRAAESGTRGAERVADPTGTGREAVGQAGAVRSEGTSAMRGNGGGVAVRGAGTAGAGGPYVHADVARGEGMTVCVVRTAESSTV